ncbi:triose-phosphate isomerase [Patescibacteria group bacterium]|nr:triose-phosphate isomerase [Patescibacteria group bacterium]
MTLLIANWKMAPEKVEQAEKLAKETLSLAKKYKKNIEFVICPSFIHLGTVVKQVKITLALGAQGVSAVTTAANTGLVSAAQLKGLGVQYAIVGHSESRARGDTNEVVVEQTARLIEKKIIPIVCIGEKTRDAQGWYLSEIKDQLHGLLTTVSKTNFKNIVIAYEPIWAIGANAEREATPLECREMVIYIRKLISDVHGEKFAATVKIIYGGSVNEHNAKYFITDGTANGLLVGRVSLEPKRYELLAKSLSL